MGRSAVGGPGGVVAGEVRPSSSLGRRGRAGGRRRPAVDLCRRRMSPAEPPPSVRRGAGGPAAGRTVDAGCPEPPPHRSGASRSPHPQATAPVSLMHRLLRRHRTTPPIRLQERRLPQHVPGHPRDSVDLPALRRRQRRPRPRAGRVRRAEQDRRGGCPRRRAARPDGDHPGPGPRTPAPRRLPHGLRQHHPPLPPRSAAPCQPVRDGGVSAAITGANSPCPTVG